MPVAFLERPLGQPAPRSIPRATRGLLGLVGLALWLLSSAQASAQAPTEVRAAPAPRRPVLVNPGFERVGSAGSPTRSDRAQPPRPVPAAAEGWSIDAPAGPVPTRTTLVPSTLPGGGAHMLHVEAGGAGHGVVQRVETSLPGRAVVSAWVRVERGRVSLVTWRGSPRQAGAGQAPGATATSTGRGDWQLLQAEVSGEADIEIGLRAQGGRAEFFLEQAELRVVEAPRRPAAPIPLPPARPVD